METEFTPLASFFGGVLIGCAALLLMATHGRIAGISGIFSRWLNEQDDSTHTSTLFLVGLVLGLPLFALLTGMQPAIQNDSPVVVMMIAGLLVGYGTVSGSGCTSGHGVCGISRLSMRSMVATGTFLAAGIIMMFLTRHVFGS